MWPNDKRKEATTLQINNPETRALLEAKLTELQQAKSDFATAKALCGQIATNLATLRKAGEASETEAQGIRAKLREVLRETMGKPSKKLHDLSADQRAAIVMHEEYTSLAAEAERELARATLEAQAPLGRIDAVRRQLRDLYAGAVIDEAIAEIAPKLTVGLRLACNAFAADGFDPRHRVFDTPEDFAMAQVSERLRPLLIAELDTSSDPVLSALVAARMEGVERISHAHMHVMRNGLSKHPLTIGMEQPS
ncbi:hypothetical protein [Niveibacterium microcysteis]|uniref:Uncharacterized protein n=1 Tax=Niveibacterium microcysteis TaxID=2811415 RepID=A0ABX7MAD9_9RHOO|nr:hypothetical protein [Niveibacterium microcysteis]QSI78687.1 hypothetical protein JY500_08805 [Niveibacterium microcysteis]